MSDENFAILNQEKIRDPFSVVHLITQNFFSHLSCAVVFRFKQVTFSLPKSEVFDLSKILCNELKNRKRLQLSYVGEFER